MLYGSSDSDVEDMRLDKCAIQQRVTKQPLDRQCGYMCSSRFYTELVDNSLYLSVSDALSVH